MPAHRNSPLIQSMATRIYQKAWGTLGLQISHNDAVALALAAHEGWQEIYDEIYKKETGHA